MIEHIFEQGEVLKTLAIAVISSLLKSEKSANDLKSFIFEPVTHVSKVKPPSPGLIADYIKICNGSPSAYRNIIPFHLFPQWGFSALSQTAIDLPFGLMRIVNGGCAITIHDPIENGQRLILTARLTDVTTSDRHIILKQHLITEGEKQGRFEAEQISIVRLASDTKKTDQSSIPKKEPRLIPEDCREVLSFFAPEDAGLQYAFVSGDFNPIHWLPPYAKASGFKQPILHGFAILGRIVEGINRNIYSGSIDKIKNISIRFEKPLFLPATCRVFIDADNNYYAGVAAGAVAVVTGNFNTEIGNEL